jgi:hypothetical protein
MVVLPIVALFSWVVTVVWTSIALGGLTYWIWAWTLPQPERGVRPSEWLLDRVVPGGADAVDVQPVVVEGILQFVLGALFLLTLPFITGGLTRLHEAIDRGMLGAWRSEALERQVAQLSASRGAAVQAEAAPARARHPRRPAAATRPPADGPRRHRAQARHRP